MSLSRNYSPEQKLPLGSYAGFVGLYNAALLASLRHFYRHGLIPERFGLADSILLGLSTHKLTRIIAKDWVTSPLRAPFARYEGPAPGGEVNESSRGTGLRKAIGDLITCPFCTGPWVALGLAHMLTARPRAARFTMSVFASVAASDFLHRLQGLADAKKAQLEAAKEAQPSRPRQHERPDTLPGYGAGAGQANVLPRH